MKPEQLGQIGQTDQLGRPDHSDQPDNTSEGQTAQTEEVRYSAQNPPPSRRLAVERFDALSLGIESIKLQLERRSESDYSCQLHYEGWKRSAEKALVFMNRERNFLKDFIQKSESEKTAELREMAETFVKRYKYVHYEKLPDDLASDLAKLNERSALLVSLRQTVSNDLATLKMTSKKLKVPESRYYEIKKVMTIVLSQIETELRVVKSAKTRVQSSIADQSHETRNKTLKRAGRFLLSLVEKHAKNLSADDTRQIQSIRALLYSTEKKPAEGEP